MCDQQEKTNEGMVSDQVGKEKKEIFDSGRTDSGFLSGVNIQSGSLASGEITPPKVQQEQESQCNRPKMKLDSGVDVSLSGNLSELYIEDEKDQKPPLPASQKDEESWKIYFQQDDDGDTQLHIAIIQGSIEVAFNLIRMIPSPLYLDVRNDHAQTALHLAVRTSQPRIVRRLVCAGANTRLVDGYGNTPLHLATIVGDLLCVRALTEPVTDLEVLAAQLRYKPEKRQSHLPEMDMNNYEGLTCLHMALMNKELTILKILVGFGANIDAQEYKSGRTCLHMAAELGDENLAGVLIRDLRADPEVPNYAGHTPFQISRRNPSFVRKLVESGAPEEDAYFSTDEEDDEEDLEAMAYIGNHRKVFVDARA